MYVTTYVGDIICMCDTYFKVSFHYTIPGMILEFIDALTPT